MISMELEVNAATAHAPAAPLGAIETGEADHHHVHEGEVAMESLGRMARVRHLVQAAQLKLIESTPALAPFLETQAACACKAGCPSCAGPTLLAPLWAATKDWLGRRFSSTDDGDKPRQLPSLSEGPVDFVGRSPEAPMPLSPGQPVEAREIADQVVQKSQQG